MAHQDVSRRTLLKGGGAALAGFTALRVSGPAQAFPGQSGQEQGIAWDDERTDSAEAMGPSGGQVIPWLDQPTPNPFTSGLGNLLKWEELDSWLTPADNFFFVDHYGIPETLDDAAWRVGIAGLVARPQSLKLTDLLARPRHEVEFTLECSGNTGTGLDFFIGGIGNARWAGARLASLLEEAGVRDEGTEVIFWGADRGTVTIRDNSGIVSAGRTGATETDSDGGLDLTITEQFARSMSLRDALSRDNLLCYEMNGQPLPPEHGFPVRLIAPGWYGVANVKWLTRIEIVDQRYAGRFMARDYVTIRETQRAGQTVWTFATVAHDRLKSAPAKVTRLGSRYAVMGAAWGAPIAAVEVKIDDGAWRAARLHGRRFRRGRSRGYAWKFWTFDWGTPVPGEHRITSRAFDVDGNMQPAPDDPFIASKRTYWESNAHITRRVLVG
jgi:DMSO/TMAO reductase YedYZ molybdopterin-dependent catalytic subunit